MYEWKTRGIDTFSYVNTLSLVRAEVEAVGQALLTEYPHAVWSKNVLGQELDLGREGFFVFRLEGQHWTELLRYGLGDTVLHDDHDARLSRALNTSLINYGISDTVGALEYALYEAGILVEELINLEVDTTFWSSRRELEARDIENIWQFTEVFFVEQDALEPGITTGHFVARRKGQKSLLHAPRFEGYYGSEPMVYTPTLERVDYVMLLPL